MKLLLGFVLLFLVQNGRAFQISDDFNGTQVDTNSWQTYIGFANSSLVESNGFLRIRNGGELISRKPFTPPFEIQGEVRFSGSQYDNLTLVFRSTGQRAIDSIEPTNGISIRIEPVGDGSSSSNLFTAQRQGDSFVYSTAIRSLVKGQFYPFRLSDSGTAFSFYFGDLTTPLLTGNETPSPGDTVILFNHLAPATSQFDLDSIQIGNPPPAHLSLYAAVELAFQSSAGTIYQLQASSDSVHWTNLNQQIQGDGSRISRLFSTQDTGKLFYRAEEILSPDQQLIEQAENLPSIIDCIARPALAGLKIGASVDTLAKCPDGTDQKQVTIFAGPNCQPGQPCPLFIVMVARVTFDCSGQIISVDGCN